MVEHILGKNEIQVQFLVGAPVDTKTKRLYNNRMYKVIGKTVTYEVLSLDDAMKYAKTLNEFVTIKGADFEVCGMFGVDAVKDGKCPDGIAYDWNKSSRIGRVKKERLTSNV